MKFIIDVTNQGDANETLKLNNLSGEVKLKFELANGQVQNVTSTLEDLSDKAVQTDSNPTAQLEALSNQAIDNGVADPVVVPADADPDSPEFADPDPDGYEDDTDWNKSEVTDTLESLSDQAIASENNNN